MHESIYSFAFIPFVLFFDNNRNIILILCQSESKKAKTCIRYHVVLYRHEILPCHTLVGEHKAYMGRQKANEDNISSKSDNKTINVEESQKVGIKVELLIIPGRPRTAIRWRRANYYSATINRAFSSTLDAFPLSSSLQKYVPP